MRRWLLALDPIAIVLFAAIGRDAHNEDGGLTDVLATASPFLIGTAAGWVLFQAWRDPADLRTGAGVLASTVAVGMIIRQVATDRGTPISFIIVASVFLGLFLLGWRAVACRFRHSVG
jgi:hypothetical protein